MGIVVNWVDIFWLIVCIGAVLFLVLRGLYNRIKIKNENAKAKRFLKEHPLCMVCQAEGRYTKATQVWIETNGNMQPRCDEHIEVKRL